MKLLRYALLTAACCLWADAARAQVVTFDFDSAPVYSGTPLNQTSGGVLAHFSSPTDFLGPRFSIQNYGTTFLAMPLFSGNYLYPSTINGDRLDILFYHPVTAISFDFATMDFHQNEVPTTLQLNAYVGSVSGALVGSASTHGSYDVSTPPMGALSFSAGTPFDFVEIFMPSQPLMAPAFAVDNVRVQLAGSGQVPTPNGLAVLLIGLASVGIPLAKRRRLGRASAA